MATTRIADEVRPALTSESLRPVVRRVLHAQRGIARLSEWLFGVLTLIVGLAVLATVPVLQLLSLGYLLEVSGRVARSGELSDGFVGVRKAARIGRVAFGILIWLLPLRIAASLRYSAWLIDSHSFAARAWTAAVGIIALVGCFQIVSGFLRGGRLRHFLLPRPVHSVKLLFRRGAIARARDRLWDFMVGLRLPHYFWLGFRGFVAALAWLVVPITMLAFAARLPEGVGALVGLLGGVLLAIALVYLPFAQAHLAAENRLAAGFDVAYIRRQFARAPIAYWTALVFTLALSVPLYLLKIEMIPREAAWLPSLLFVVSIFPARLLAGWALGRAANRYRRRHWLVRWLSRLAMLPVVAIYVAIVYFTQYLSWYGPWSLYEQHAFLVPAPFLGY